MIIEHDPRRDPATTRLLVQRRANRFLLAVFLAIVLLTVLAANV